MSDFLNQLGEFLIAAGVAILLIRLGGAFER